MNDLMKDPSLEAIRWLREHSDEHLSADRNQLAHRLAGYLAENLDISTRRALVLAWHAIGDFASGGAEAWRIDHNHSTSSTLFLFCPATGESRVLLAGDIAKEPISWPVAGTAH